MVHGPEVVHEEETHEYGTALLEVSYVAYLAEVRGWDVGIYPELEEINKGGNHAGGWGWVGGS